MPVAANSSNVPAKMKAAPRGPDDDMKTVRLISGEVCDQRGCPAIAYVRVTAHKPPTEPDKYGERIGAPLHFCVHHAREHELALLLLRSTKAAAIIDESKFVLA